MGGDHLRPGPVKEIQKALGIGRPADSLAKDRGDGGRGKAAGDVGGGHGGLPVPGAEEESGDLAGQIVNIGVMLGGFRGDAEGEDLGSEMGASRVRQGAGDYSTPEEERACSSDSKHGDGSLARRFRSVQYIRFDVKRL